MAAHYSGRRLAGAAGKAARQGEGRGRGQISLQTYILGRLRGLTFVSVAECNEAIARVRRRMNDRALRNLGLSRRELSETIECDALIALPADDWEFGGVEARAGQSRLPHRGP